MPFSSSLKTLLAQTWNIELENSENHIQSLSSKKKVKSLFRNGEKKTKLNSSYIPLKPKILRLHYRFHFHSTPSGICRYSVWICWKRHSGTSPLSSFGRVELSRHSLKMKSNIFMNWSFHSVSNFKMKSHVRPFHKCVLGIWNTTD